MTEEEAKKKWCPFTRNGNEAGCNRAGEQNGTYPVQVCIGSQCMAWRWRTSPDDARDNALIGLEDPKHIIANGYCGLAGKL